MNTIEEQLKNLDYGSPPADFRRNVMRRIAFYRRRWVLRTASLAVSANIILSGWHLWFKAVENGFLWEVRALYSDFSANYYFFAETWHTILEYLPAWSLGIFAFNIALGLYIIHIYRKSVYLRAA